MVEATARQLDRCDVCGIKIHKHDLVRTNMAFLASAGNNYIQQSSYASGWLCDASDAGTISSGSYADRMRIVVSDDNTRTESFGVQTWDGAGTFYGLGADISSWTSFVFAADVGPYDRETSPEMTFTLGLIDSDGNNPVVYRTVITAGSTRAWFTLNIADLPAGKTAAALYPYVATTSTNKWWVDRLQLEKDVVKLGTFVPTLGSSVDRIDTRMMTVRKVCPDCREPLLSKTERHGKLAEQRTEEPIALDIQEI